MKKRKYHECEVQWCNRNTENCKDTFYKHENKWFCNKHHQQLKNNGEIMDFKANVYGNGIYDMEKGWKRKNELNLRIYDLWHGMIRRCYSEEYQKKYPTYIGCYVSERWLKLSNFIEDIKLLENYDKWTENKERYELDKDVKSSGKNKCYCLEQCMFVTQAENTRQARKTQNFEYLKDNKNKTKKVAQYDLNGNLIKIWSSSAEISNFFDFNYNTFKNHVKGKKYSNEYKGFIWKYYNEE